MNFYTSVFKNAKIGEISRYGEGSEKQQCGWLKDQFGISWQVVLPILQIVLA